MPLKEFLNFLSVTTEMSERPVSLMVESTKALTFLSWMVIRRKLGATAPISWQ